MIEVLLIMLAASMTGVLLMSLDAELDTVLLYWARTVAQAGRLILSVVVWILFASLGSIAQPHQAQQVAPRCDLVALNHAYVAVLNQERHKADATAPVVHFDQVLLRGTVLHNERMERLDSLFHAYPLPCAELAGTLLENDPTEPARLARFIFERLKASPPHNVIQKDAERVFVSVSATQKFYCVRLSRTPSTASPRR